MMPAEPTVSVFFIDGLDEYEATHQDDHKTLVELFKKRMFTNSDTPAAYLTLACGRLDYINWRIRKEKTIFREGSRRALVSAYLTSEVLCAPLTKPTILRFFETIKWLLEEDWITTTPILATYDILALAWMGITTYVITGNPECELGGPAHHVFGRIIEKFLKYGADLYFEAWLGPSDHTPISKALPTKYTYLIRMENGILFEYEHKSNTDFRGLLSSKRRRFSWQALILDCQFANEQAILDLIDEQDRRCKNIDTMGEMESCSQSDHTSLRKAQFDRPDYLFYRIPR